MLLRTATLGDLPQLLALERSAHGRAFVGQWSEDRHHRNLADPDVRYLASDTPGGDLAAYVILRGLLEDSRSLELKRIVVAHPGRGVGRQILAEVLRIAFEDIQAHRLFLDVFEDNARARHLYEALGFVYEGTLREAAQREGVFANLRLMSMLASEYGSRRNRG